MKKNKKKTPVTKDATDVVEMSENVPVSEENTQVSSAEPGEKNEVVESSVVTDEISAPTDTDAGDDAAEVLDDVPLLWEENEREDEEAEAAPTLARVRLSPAPFVRTSDKTRSLMLDVIIALLPAYLWGIYTFGTRVLTVGVVTISCCVLFEALMQLILHRPVKIGDLSAVVTGLLLTMGFSSAVPIWMPIVGAFVSIVIMKGLFGGIGRNLVNPALAARMLLLLWPSQLHIFTAPGERLSGIGLTHVESVTTPLDALHAGAFPNVMLSDLILGRTAGCIGEIFPILLLAGGIYLIVRRVISWRIPVAYIGTVACLTFFFPQIEGSNVNFMLCELFSGGLLLGAFFMATDPVTSPTTPYGHLIYGVGCGVLTVLFRYFGYFAEGMPFAILIMNLLVWVIDRYIVPTPFGGRVAHEKS